MAFIFNGSDMRVYDNKALAEALASHREIRLYYVKDKWHWPKSPHAQAFVESAIEKNNIPCRIVESIAEIARVKHIYMNRARYSFDSDTHPYASWARAQGIELHVFDDWSCLPAAPRETPYKVFTPFYNAVNRGPFVRPSGAPIDIADGDDPNYSRAAAFAIIRRANRNYDHDLGSKISSFISRGVISIREAISRVRDPELMRQMLWREFYYQIAMNDPAAMSTAATAAIYNLSPRASERLRRWKQGRTEFEYINDAMNMLRATGQMPNRLRMLVAELLTSRDYYGVHWWHGEKHFAEFLEDHDVILNRANWLWVADASRPWSKPSFRGFNLDRQAKNKAVIAFVADINKHRKPHDDN